ncbi:MAG: hypothetical protein AAB575_02890 [Patescibacteria group bacterium]
MEKHSLIRSIYLYLFALLGLVLLTIGTVRFLDMGLKAFVFTKADDEEFINYSMPPYKQDFVERNAATLEKAASNKESVSVKLTSDEVLILNSSISEWKNWEEKRSKIDVKVSRRQRDASINLALMVVGLPLYLYHWFTIKKDTKANV